MYSAKGISLPVNIVIILLVAIFVLLAVSAFFLSRSSPAMSSMEAQHEFYKGCNRLKENNCDYTMLSYNDPFMRACKILYGFDTKLECASICGCKELPSKTPPVFNPPFHSP
ncbi:MAG: hypothetical protein J7J92_03020 [Candidatus Aenigmarchaeota archaeon]|nr:hypothetical protein [Candidatus Aenigmarchaeota archaeon]